jgi:hypothetical protein
MLSLRELKKAGFAKSGIFHRLDGAVRLTGEIPKQSGIYLLVIGGKIRYVGKTERLSSRLRAYENGLGKDLPRRIVHTGILKSVGDKSDVEIYTLPID